MRPTGRYASEISLDGLSQTAVFRHLNHTFRQALKFEKQGGKRRGSGRRGWILAECKVKDSMRIRAGAGNIPKIY